MLKIDKQQTTQNVAAITAKEMAAKASWGLAGKRLQIFEESSGPVFGISWGSWVCRFKGSKVLLQHTCM